MIENKVYGDQEKSHSFRSWLQGILILLVLCWWATTGVAQETGMMETTAGLPITFVYDSWEIENYQQENEEHIISGNPASVTAEMDGSPIVLSAPSFKYSRKKGIISANSNKTHRVMITDGTFTITADKGQFNTELKEAKFENNIRWVYQLPDSTHRGSCQYITVFIGDSGIKSIKSEGKPKEPGRINLQGEESWLGGFGLTGPSPTTQPESEGKQQPEENKQMIPEVDRVESGLER